MSHTHFNTKNPKGHLKYKEHELIEKWLNEDKKQDEIARLLGRDRSTIYREVKRGKVPQIINGKKVVLYRADYSETKYLQNRQRSQSKGLKAFSGRFWYKLKKRIIKAGLKAKTGFTTLKPLLRNMLETTRKKRSLALKRFTAILGKMHCLSNHMICR